MGNRAVVVFDEWDDDGLAVYLHWNGGRDSIEAFLKTTRILMGDRLGDSTYSIARFIQVCGTYMVGNLSFGVYKAKHIGKDQDNGVYIVDSSTMSIKDRIIPEFYQDNPLYTFEEQREHPTNEFTNECIDIINAGYTHYNKDAGYSQDLLPTAEEYDRMLLDAGKEVIPPFVPDK